MASIDILGKDVPIGFEIGLGATAADLDRTKLVEGAEEMVTLINGISWPPHYRDAFRGMKKIIFFAGKVMVDGHLMDRPCCDQDDAIFYWEARNFSATQTPTCGATPISTIAGTSFSSKRPATNMRTP